MTPHSRPTSSAKPSQEGTDGRRLWLNGGADLLRDGGPPALKLHALAAHVGRTTGSFYHHFSGMNAYLDALAADFGGEALAEAMAAADHPDPEQRLRRYLKEHESRGVDRLYTAMRAWARSFPPAAAAIDEAEQTVLPYLEVIFVELGSDRITARAQTTLLFSLGTAQSRTPWTRGTKLRERMLRMILDAGELPDPGKPAA